MKAFNASIFTEQTQASLKEDAYKLIEQNPANIRSILEYEDDAIIMEMDARREYYISLLESQHQGLNIIDEAVSSKLIAAIIAGAIAVVTAVIALITGKGISGNKNTDVQSIKKDATKPLRDLVDKEKSISDEIKTSDTYKSLDKILSTVERDSRRGKGGYTNISNDYNSTPSGSSIDLNTFRKIENSVNTVNNIYWMEATKGFKYNGVSIDQMKQVAETTDITITNYIFPSFDVIEGNIRSVDDLISIGNSIIRIFHDLFEFNENPSDSIDEDISRVKSSIEDINGNIEAINIGSEETTTINASKYLKPYPLWVDVVKHGQVSFRYPKCSNKLYDLRNTLSNIIKKANDINPAKTDTSRLEKAKSLAMLYRREVINMMNKIGTACKQYYKMAISDYKQMGTVCNKISEIAKGQAMSESVIFENGIVEIYSDILFNEFNNISDTITRLSIYIHENQLRAINEEALIFSETGISDSEKFDRLMAVNEALSNKIKRGYYNAIAAIKEIFRKFMEKLTANFGTTKVYLDRYKNIILKSDFNPQDIYKTQDLKRGIYNIINTECPAMDFTQINNEDADDPVRFFNKFVRPRLRQVDMQRDKMPDENGGIGAINEFFKSYFCMQNHDVEINGKQFQQEIGDYYEFLYDIRKINNSIKKSLKTIDDTSARVMKQAGVDVNKPPQEGNGAATPVNASAIVYSNLYQKYFTLSEDGILIEAEKVQSGDQPATKYGAQNIKNVADKPDGTDDTADIKNTERSAIDKRVQTYVNVCSSMLKAKMSACEFIRNECMQIIRDHVKRYVGNANANPKSQKES